MGINLIVDQMRSAVFPDRWTESRTWAAGLMAWHTCAHLEIWSPTQGHEDEFAEWIQALIACALHQAAENSEPVLEADLARAADSLTGAATAVNTIDTLPEAPPGPVASLLHSVVVQLERGNLEIKKQVLHIIGLAHQVLADHATQGGTVDERLPALARASLVLESLQDATVTHPQYPGAPSLPEHLEIAQRLEEARALADLSGQPEAASARRERLLQRAALADRWLLVWGQQDQPAERLDQAQDLALALFRQDRGNASATDDGDPGQGPRSYVREQYELHVLDSGTRKESAR
ncbi:hypothetical protein [Streptacidiphilus sp. EB103A]|uniref:hypothetical protein n=1 Tax=Streptacidiphilus sp. EB103A TaxID=3156275 RepID=UPI003515731A